MNVALKTGTATNIAPAAPFIKFDGDGRPYIEGFRCRNCDATFTEMGPACAKCGARNPFAAFRAVETGKLFTFSVVHRSYPGIKVPFVSAIVDLDDGLVLKGNLLDVEARPEAVSIGMPVQVIFADANGLKTPEGTPYISYFFVPAHQ